MSYLDLNDILSTATRVSAQTSRSLSNLGFLDSSLTSSDLPENWKIEIPLWMSLPLLRHGLTVELPNPYSPMSREILEASAPVVDLHKLGPYFYDTGIHVVTKLGGRGQFDFEPVLKSITDSLRNRFRMIMDMSQNSEDCDAVDQMTKLDSLERELFSQGREAKRKVNLWFTRKTGILNAATMVSRHNKRKASALL